MCALLVAGVATCVVRDSAAAPDDPAARGLDAYIELPESAVSGTTLSVDVRSFGFRSSVEAEPLGHATVDAAWSEGDPTPTSVETDASGVATLKLAVPEGRDEQVGLAIKLRYGSHARTRTFQVRRTPRHEIDMRLAKNDVRPGSEVPIWVFIRDRSTGGPAASLGFTVALLEGGVVRQSIPLTTDASGAATTLVSIPETEDPTLGWEVRAATNETIAADAVTEVNQVEEVPARPSLKVTFDARRVPAGTLTKAIVHLTDAANEPLEAATVHYVVIDKADHAPTDEEWEKSRAVQTDALGAATIPVDIPVVGFSTARSIHVRTEVGGRNVDSYDNMEIIAKAGPVIRVDAEGGFVVPGLAQRLIVSARDGWDKPIATTFDVQGDGLRERVTTDAAGRAETLWKVPIDVGARRDIGPCAGSVAATVRVTATTDAPKELIDAGAVPVCIVVNREVGARAEVASPIARAGDAVPISLAIGDPKTIAKEKGPVSLSAAQSSEPTSALAWVPGTNGSLSMPETRGGVFRLSATLPRATEAAITGSALVLVKPRVLPKLTMRVTGGRPTPGGEVDVEAKLTDESGAPLEGSVMGVVFDETAIEPGVWKGTDARDGIPTELDTRLTLCKEASVDPADCDAVLAGDPSGVALLRASMREGNQGVVIANDPGGTSKKEMRETFHTVLMNLEGAVFEATNTPGRLRDVLKKGAKGNEFNPEVMTLVTSVLETPPTTPGGEPFTLDDLVTVDSQVTYDNVAKRVARLKMFNVLSAIRSFRNANALDPSEPVLADPNGILRRILQHDNEDGSLDTSELADPWGGTMEFVKGRAGGLPFISPIPGWELHVGGPDGKIGTGDDLADPFARVVKSGSPYAVAMGEDKIVDAKLDMRVADATVEGWSSLLTEFTGTRLSGTGDGIGSGSGRLSGSHRTKPPSIRSGATTMSRPFGAYELSAPVRTDGHGVAHLHMPLGADETTYRVMLVAMPDKAGPAATFSDVPTSLPLSVRVDGGEKWIAGDEAFVNVKVTNRSDGTVHASVKLAAEGSAALAKGETGTREIDVPKRRASIVRVHVRATSEGEARLLASVSAGSAGSDSIDHRIAVGPRGRHVRLGRARWLTTEATIPLMKADATRTLEGDPELVLERFDDALTGVIPTLDPDRITSLGEAVDAADAYERLSRALAANHPNEAARAGRKEIQALGRFSALAAKNRAGSAMEEGLFRRAQRLSAHPETASIIALVSSVGECPKEGTTGARELLAAIESEPPPTSGGVAACWEATASNAMREVARKGNPLELARIILAFADRPHRSKLALSGADALESLVTMFASGEISLPASMSEERSARAMVYAAFVRATSIGWKGAAPPETLLGWLLVQRGADGGFGSVSATRAAVDALAGYPSPSTSPTVLFGALDKDGGTIETGGFTGGGRMTLVPRTDSIRLTLERAPKEPARGVLLRIEQKALLGFRDTRLAEDLASPISAELKWPDTAVVEHTATLEVRFIDKGGAGDLVTRIPLPPGASLAEPVSGVRQLEGALLVNGDSRALTLPFEIPLRFGIAGDFTIPDTVVHANADRDLTGFVPSTRFHVSEK